MTWAGLTEKQQLVRDTVLTKFADCLLYGGARSTKTFLLCYAIATRALMAPGSRHLITRHHQIDCRTSVMMDTWPKMMRLAYPNIRYDLNRSDMFATLPDGAEVWFGGLDDSDRVDKVLGREYATIYANECSQIAYETVVTLRTRLAQNVLRRDGRPLDLKGYYDLNPVGRGHWTYKEFVENKDPVTGLPFRSGSRGWALLNPGDNPYLPAETLERLEALPMRQRMRFFLGQYLSEVPGALWPLDVIDRLRVSELPEMQRVVVGVDPSGSDGTGGDSQGIVAAGLGVDNHGYILKDASVKMAPKGWASKAVGLYTEMGADCIVAEINFGGAMVESTLRTVDENIAYHAVTASRGKHIRAEPVASLYELGRVHHYGTFHELEEQMGLMTTAGYQGGASPDRLDALVWAIHELMLPAGQDSFGFWAMVQAENALKAPVAAEREIEYARGSVEWERQQMNGTH